MAIAVLLAQKLRGLGFRDPSGCGPTTMNDSIWIWLFHPEAAFGQGCINVLMLRPVENGGTPLHPQKTTVSFSK